MNTLEYARAMRAANPKASVQQKSRQQPKTPQQYNAPALSGIARLTRSKPTQPKTAISRLAAGGSSSGPARTPNKTMRPSDPQGRRLTPSTRPSSRPSDPLGLAGTTARGKVKLSMQPQLSRESNKSSNPNDRLHQVAVKQPRASLRTTVVRAPLVESPYARGNRQLSTAGASLVHGNEQSTLLHRRLDSKPAEPRVPDRPLEHSFPQTDDPSTSNASILANFSTLKTSTSNTNVQALRSSPLAPSCPVDDRNLSSGSVDRLSSTSTGSSRHRVSAVESFRASRRVSLQKAEEEKQKNRMSIRPNVAALAPDEDADRFDCDHPSTNEETTTNTTVENITYPDVSCPEEIDCNRSPVSDTAQCLEASTSSPRWTGRVERLNSDSIMSTSNSSVDSRNHSVSKSDLPVTSHGRVSLPVDHREVLPDRAELRLSPMTSRVGAGPLPDRQESEDLSKGLSSVKLTKRRKNSRFSETAEEIDLGNVQKLRRSLRGRRSLADAHETPKLRWSNVGISVTGNIKVEDTLQSIPHSDPTMRRPLRSIATNTEPTDTGSEEKDDSDLVHPTPVSLFSTAVFQSRFGLPSLDEELGLENDEDVEDLGDVLHG